MPTCSFPFHSRKEEKKEIKAERQSQASDWGQLLAGLVPSALSEKVPAAVA